MLKNEGNGADLWGNEDVQAGELELQVALIVGFRMQRATGQCSREHVAHSLSFLRRQESLSS